MSATLITLPAVPDRRSRLSRAHGYADHRDGKYVGMLFGEEHVRRYRATDGAEGYIWTNGTTILLLTTTGRRSGESRTSPLIFQPYGAAYLVVASKGGADQPPAWYLNLESNPTVGVQIKGDKFVAHARTASPEEKPDMWRVMAQVWPDYDRYQKRTEREIPVVVLERES